MPIAFARESMWRSQFWFFCVSVRSRRNRRHQNLERHIHLTEECPEGIFLFRSARCASRKQDTKLIKATRTCNGTWSPGTWYSFRAPSRPPRGVALSDLQLCFVFFSSCRCPNSLHICSFSCSASPNSSEREIGDHLWYPGLHSHMPRVGKDAIASATLPNGCCGFHHLEYSKLLWELWRVALMPFQLSKL